VVVGICDLSPSLVEAFGDRWGVAGRYVDFPEMLAAARPDVVHVLTPPSSHRDLTLAALAQGAHVFVEKPIAPTLAEYLEMRDAALESGLMLVENYNYRFTDVVIGALRLCREGRIGDLVNMDATFTTSIAQAGGVYTDDWVEHFGHALPGGALQNFASHPLSFVLAAMNRPTRVAAVRRRRAVGGRSDDELRALLDDGRITASITLTSHSRPARVSYTLNGTEGSIEVDVIARRLHVDAPGGSLDTLRNGMRHGLGYVASTFTLGARAATGRHDYFEGLERLLGQFYRSIGSGGPAPISVGEMDDVNHVLHELFL
jgi:predicted dehydrogenase